MEAIKTEILQLLNTHGAKIVGAVLVLVLGWVASLLLSGLVRVGLEKLRPSHQETDTPEAKAVKELKWPQWFARAVFYLCMLFVLMAFLQVVGLSTISEPLNAFLTKVFGYLPRLIGPAVLFIIAWIVATALRAIIKRTISSPKVSEKLIPFLGTGMEKRATVASGIGDTVYLLVFFLAFLAILDMLGLSSLLAPLQTMTNEIVGFLPNIIAAALTLFIGMLLAKVLQRIVGNLLSSTGIDNATDKLGLASLLGKKKLSDFFALLVYLLVLIPVMVAGLNALQLEAVTGPSSRMLGNILAALPSIFAATLIVVIAYVVGRVLSKMVTNLLLETGFDKIPFHLGLTHDPNNQALKPSVVVGYLIMTAVILFAAIEAMELLNFEALAQLMTGFVVFAGEALIGIVIFAAGMYLANIASKAILSSDISQAKLLALVCRIAILVLSGAMALREMGIANEIITVAFGLVLGGLTLALAIAFGVGGRNEAAQIWKDTADSFRHETTTKIKK